MEKLEYAKLEGGTPSIKRCIIFLIWPARRPTLHLMTPRFRPDSKRLYLSAYWIPYITFAFETGYQLGPKELGRESTLSRDPCLRKNSLQTTANCVETMKSHLQGLCASSYRIRACLLLSWTHYPIYRRCITLFV